MTGGPELSIVIPCFNEEENVRAICAAVTVAAEAHARSHEIILIDNCSTDGTRAVLRQICAADPRVRAIFNNRNYGQMRSPTYGLYQAEGEAVIGMCADFQDPPELIGEFMAQWRAGAQVVLGQRRSEPASWLLGRLRKGGYRLIQLFGDQEIVPGATGFGLFDREVIDTLAAWNEPEPFFRGMVVESGFRLAVIPFDRPARAAGESKNGFRSLLSFSVSAIAGSARKLLRLPIVVALLSAAASMALLAAAIVAAVLDGPAAALLVLFLVFSMFAVLMLFMGLIGEQIRLLAERSRNVPLVIERERINFPAGRERPAARTFVQRP